MRFPSAQRSRHHSLESADAPEGFQSSGTQANGSYKTPTVTCSPPFRAAIAFTAFVAAARVSQTLKEEKIMASPRSDQRRTSSRDMNSTMTSPFSVPKSIITGRFFSGADGNVTPSSSGQSFSLMPRLKNSFSIISSASASASITGGLTATQPKPPLPSPPTATAASGQTSVEGALSTACRAVSPSRFGASVLGAADAAVAFASSASDFRVIAAVPIEATTDFRFAQREGTRDSSAFPISWIVG